MAAKNAIVKVAFELESSHVCEKRSNLVLIRRPRGTQKWPIWVPGHDLCALV